MANLKTSVVRRLEDLADLEDEWRALAGNTQALSASVDPVWTSEWLRCFLGTDELACLVVRDGEELVGVAPLYSRSLLRSRLRGPRVVQLVGSGRHAYLTETPQPVIAAGRERVVGRAIVRAAYTLLGPCDWLELTLGPEQGWLEPQWLEGASLSAGAFIVHRGTRPCVVADLPSSPEEFAQGLSRNVRESVRRGRNRLRSQGISMEFEIAREPGDMAIALAEMLALHAARARMRGKVKHPDQFADPRDREFLQAIVFELSKRGGAAVYLLRLNGAAAAARVVFVAPGGCVLSVAGSNPSWWEYSAPTLLTLHICEDLIHRRVPRVNLSPGPDVAKLRWGGSLALFQDFAVIGPRQCAHAAFALHWQMRSFAVVARERRRHRRL